MFEHFQLLQLWELVLEVNAKYDEFVNHLYYKQIFITKKTTTRQSIYSLDGGRPRRRQAATANKQHVIAQKRPASPANTPTTIGVQLAGDDVDSADSVVCG